MTMQIQLDLLAFILGRILTNMKRNLSKYQKLLADFDYLMDGLDTLSPGSFHNSNSTNELAELLDHMKRRLIEHFQE